MCSFQVAYARAFRLLDHAVRRPLALLADDRDGQSAARRAQRRHRKRAFSGEDGPSDFGDDGDTTANGSASGSASGGESDFDEYGDSDDDYETARDNGRDDAGPRGADGALLVPPLSPPRANPPPQRPRARYVLVWHDEFEYTGVPDPSKWEWQTDCNNWIHDRGHNEQQWYMDGRAENAWVSGGTLKIAARRETDWPGTPYTSARLRTRGRGDWLYGRFEVRALHVVVKAPIPYVKHHLYGRASSARVCASRALVVSLRRGARATGSGYGLLVPRCVVVLR